MGRHVPVFSGRTGQCSYGRDNYEQLAFGILAQIVSQSYHCLAMWLSDGETALKRNEKVLPKVRPECNKHFLYSIFQDKNEMAQKLCIYMIKHILGYSVLKTPFQHN